MHDIVRPGAAGEVFQLLKQVAGAQAGNTMAEQAGEPALLPDAAILPASAAKTV